MNRILIAVFACISIYFIACQKEISFTNPSPGTDPVTATIQGNVVDENGVPAPGATITVGSKTAVTDAKGYFRIKNASLDKYTSLVAVSKPGYFKAFRVFSASTAVNHVKVKLIKKELAGSFNAADGGSITMTNGSKVEFSSNSFAKANGGAYTGTVKVYASFIDPTLQDIAETVPGSMLANDKDGKKVILASYGMMAVEMESATGEKLQLSSGSTAKLHFEIPAGLQSSAPAQIPLWYVDETTGVWKEEGTATKNGTVYTGDVKHFTYWNCDVPGPTVNLTATLVNQQGQPLVFTEVDIRPAGSYASAHGITDSAGQLNGPVPANTNLIMEVKAPYPCYNIIYTQNIGPYSGNVNLGTITINNQQSMLTFQGRVLNCSGNPVTNGFALVEYENIPRYAPVNSSGNFSLSIISCGNGAPTCTVTGTDSQAQQQSPPMVVTVTTPVTTTGDLTACGTSTIEFLNYSVDANTVNLSSTVLGDSFHTSDTLGTPIRLFISASRSQTQYFQFGFDNNGTPGTYPTTSIYIGGAIMSSITQPFMVTLTNYPAIGGYYEGSVAGQYKDPSNVTHNVSATFRVKRR